ncbi:GEVED domain-containing protein [Hymenobacter sp. ASUV-10]|uniref:GEVED domain-containing protein n=1 Tax=Hymenobacter aranciens TaxID=3063996 RepID=A0ABT9BGY9_9BACT|nr:GEVED domain-containing protein [Hymenobacter sp. ASUV-10]MDO7876267.1 GEVED domain-containing protein [Hymenobacter sp. ASUV-10]
MNVSLRAWKQLSISVLTLGLSGLLGTAAEAQCPATPAACTPGRASNANAGLFGMGIANVTLRSGTTALINNSTGNQAEGYVDYACRATNPIPGAALLVGQNYTLTVSNSAAGVFENVRAWVDFDNDGAFGTAEQVLSSNNAATHTVTFAPPATTVLGTALRLRVASDYANVAVPTACSTPQYSQVEDYSITVTANSNPPVAAFTTSGLTTCSGCVQFTDASQNVPTAWAWNFGDGQTSTDRNPNHCYATAGTYTATLVATNAAGSSAAATATIVYTTQVPLAAACSPATNSYCCGYGVTRFQLGTIDNASVDGAAGYQDFTCPQRTQLTVGVAHPLVISLGSTSTNQDTRVYLDLNNDGTLTASELIYEALNQASVSGNITLPGSTILNQPLRLRVVTDAGGNNPQPCASPISGQVEDYTIIALPNTMPPVAAFTSNYVAGACINPVQFTDASTNAPTSWSWDFGDGSPTSTLQNPSHQYAASGTYTVTLTTTNANGNDVETKTDYVNVQVPCLVYCPSNGVGQPGPGGQTQPSQLFITRVAVANAQPAFTNNTRVETGGYGNYTAQTITVNPGPVNLTVAVNLNLAHRTFVWMDVNQDGVLDNSELVVNGNSTAGPNASTFTTTFTPPASMAAGAAIRMRVRVSLAGSTSNACAVNLVNAEVEDYTFRIQPLATREAQNLPALAVYPNPTQDGRLHLNLSDASASGTYTATVENLLGARLLETSLRLAPSADAELNIGALAKGVYLLRLRDAQGHTALRRVVRE